MRDRNGDKKNSREKVLDTEMNVGTEAVRERERERESNIEWGREREREMVERET